MPRGKKRGRAASGDGSIRKKIIKKNGKEYTYWEARYTNGFDPETGKQKQHSISGKTQAEVAQKLREVTAEIGQGVFKEACKLTVGQWLNIWVQDYLIDIKPKTLESYQRQINLHINPALNGILLEKLNSHTIQHFYNSCTKEGLSPKSVKNIHGVLHRALQQAVSIGHLRTNPSDACTLPRVERKELKPLDDDAIHRFIKAVQGHPFEILYLVTLFTGMRQGEVLGLTWDCVDFDSRTLLICKQLQSIRVSNEHYAYQLASTKNGKFRKITLPDFVVDLLHRQWSKQAEWKLRAGLAWNNSGLVFTNELGEHLALNTVYKHFKKLAAKIGSPDTRFHDLRHSYAVASLRAGDDIKTVQGNLGHATAAFTLDIYGHVTDQMKRDSAERMQKFIESVSG